MQNKTPSTYPEFPEAEVPEVTRTGPDVPVPAVSSPDWTLMDPDPRVGPATVDDPLRIVIDPPVRSPAPPAIDRAPPVEEDPVPSPALSSSAPPVSEAPETREPNMTEGRPEEGEEPADSDKAPAIPAKDKQQNVRVFSVCYSEA